MTLTRRTMMTTSAAALAAPFVPGTARAASTDVVVIGAGAAGLAAARDLTAKGLSVTLIEASGRIGGRAHTDTDIFGVPYDVGAHWLHSAEENPFAAYGRAQGFDIYRASDEEELYIGNRAATTAEWDSYEKAMRKASRAMNKAGRKGLDVSPASVLPDLGEWAATVDMMQGAYEIAKDLDDFSCADWYTGADGTDHYCREGFGALLAHSARDVPVSLNTTARVVRWGGSGVEVDTDQGLITARAVVVTVSMGVLASGAIRFDPALPAQHDEIFQGLTMGHYNHVAVRFDRNFMGVGADGYMTMKVEADANGTPQGFAALVDASGTGVSYCDLGGEFARQMSQAGPEATQAYVIDRLKSIFGAKVEKHLIGQHHFDWTADPLTRGAYAAAAPGAAWTRAALRKPLAERLWFAGEALSEGHWATVAGAHKSGQQAAREVAQVLG